MSLSYKFVLDKRRKQEDCIYPIKLRVYDVAGNKEKSLGIYVHEKDWNEEMQIISPSAPDYKTNSFKLNSVKTKIDRHLLLAEDEEFDITADVLLGSLEKKKVQVSSISLQDFSQTQIAALYKSGKAGTALAYSDAVTSIAKYSGKKQLKFEDINYVFLEKYNADMLAKGLKVNSIAAYLRSIRAIYNKAIKSDIVSADKYPFTKFKIETEDTPSRKLTIEELQALFSCKVEEGTSSWHYRNYFILSFCLIGINFADLFTLEPKDIANNNVSYKRNKTGRLYSFSLHPIARKILNYYSLVNSNNSGYYVLPNLPYGLDSLGEKKKVKQLCKVCGKYMKQIGLQCGILNPISTYYARYSWANIAKKLGYSNDLIAEALGHEYGNNVTNIYLDNYSNEVISELNSHVLATVFKTV